MNSEYLSEINLAAAAKPRISLMSVAKINLEHGEVYVSTSHNGNNGFTYFSLIRSADYTIGSSNILLP